MLDRLKIDRSRIRLVVNRFHKKARLSLRDVESVLDTETFWSIPNDFEPVSLGIDRGSPAVVDSRRSKVARSLKKLAAQIANGLEEPEEDQGDTPEAAPLARKDMEPARSRPARAAPEGRSISAGKPARADDPQIAELNEILGT
jgi:MinD-like ATPase involved in chromosome partitioning or flagellar assembly